MSKFKLLLTFFVLVLLLIILFIIFKFNIFAPDLLYTHLLFSVEFIILVSVIFFNKNLNDIDYKLILLGFLLLYPFYLVSSYPFDLIHILSSIMLSLLGFFLPFINLKITWWIFSLGGLTPIAPQHKWLQNYGSKRSKTSYKSVSITIAIFSVFLGNITYQILSKSILQPYIFTTLQFIASFCVFGMGLTIGAYYYRILKLAHGHNSA